MNCHNDPCACREPGRCCDRKKDCCGCGPNGIDNIWAPIITIALLGSIFGGNNGCR